MSDCVPFITGEDVCSLVNQIYSDSKTARIPLTKAEKYHSTLNPSIGRWIDPCFDGFHKVDTRKDRHEWFDYMKTLVHADSMANPSFQAKPEKGKVDGFVAELLTRCTEFDPLWITIPQLPMIDENSRNDINKQLAQSTSKWRDKSGFSGKLILPIVITHQKHTKTKVVRSQKIQVAKRCFQLSGADGIWIVDKGLSDDSGSHKLRLEKYEDLFDFHTEINEAIDTPVRIGGPYWGLNLVMWVRGLINRPAVGVGTAYQYYLAGGHSRPPSARIAIPFLRRRVKIGSALKDWLAESKMKFDKSHACYSELEDLEKRFTVLSQTNVAREQVARFYKEWIVMIEKVPPKDRAVWLYDDFQTSFKTAKTARLSDLVLEAAVRNPAAIAKAFMLCCLD